MKAIGIILAGGNNRMMRELSNKRAIAAMPIAGSYRAIDFALSNGGILEESREDYLYSLLQLQQRAVTGIVEQQIHYIRICSS